jgi:hypothetical protein
LWIGKGHNMKCRIALVILVAAIAAIGALATPSPSAAGTTAEDAVIDDSANWSRIEGLIETGTGTGFDTADLYSAAGGSGGTYVPGSAREVVAGMTEAADAGGIGVGIAASEYLPIAITAGSALLIGWQVGGAIDHWLGISDYFGSSVTYAANYGAGDWVSVRCTDNSGGASPGSGSGSFPGTRFSGQIGSVHGQVYGDSGDCLDAIATYGLSAPFTIYMATIQRTTGCTGSCIGDPTQGTWDNNFSCASPCTPGGSTDANMRTMLMSIEGSYGATHSRLYYRQGSDSACSPGCVGQMYLTQAQMDLTRAMVRPATTTNPGGSPRTVPVPAPVNTTCTYSSTCGTRVRTIIKARTTTQKWIVHVLDPTVVPTDPALEPTLPLLAPQPNETYDDYITRLQASGWVGTATEVDEATAVDGYGPSAVTRVQYTPAGGTLKVLDPLVWPSVDPTIPDNQDITVRKNTTDALPAGGGSPGGCSCPPINIDPLKGITVGTSFPFGALTWFQDAMGSPTATNLDFTLHLPIGDTDVNTQSTWWEANRSTYYPIEEFLITVAFFFVFATRILHLGKQDD